MSQGGATVALAGFMAKEWLCDGESGVRGPYLAMMPWDAAWPPEGEQEQEHVLWWSEKQVDTLVGSDAYEDAVGLRDQVSLAAKVTKALIGASVRRAYRSQKRPFWEVFKADDDIERAVRGAFVSILSRAVTEEDSEEEESRLVPLLDMMQHESGGAHNVRHCLEHDDEGGGERRVVVRARRPLRAGEELINCYADDDLPPARFLTRFGFVPGESVGEFVSAINRR